MNIEILVKDFSGTTWPKILTAQFVLGDVT